MAGTASFAGKGNVHANLDAITATPYHRIIAALVAKYKPQGGELLDIGCGMGQLEQLLAEAGWPGRIFVADAYDVCLQASASHPNVTGTYKIAEKEFDIAKVVDRSFDAIVMSHVLEHIHNPSWAVGEVMSLLNSGGILILAVPNPVRPMVFVGNMFRRHYANRGHVQTWDRSHWRIFLENALELEVAEYASDFVDLPKHHKSRAVTALGVWLAKPFPWLSFSNIAVVRAKPNA